MLFVVIRSENMSNKDEESEIVISIEEEDAGRYFVFSGDFAPCHGEPLAASVDKMEDKGLLEETALKGQMKTASVKRATISVRTKKVRTAGKRKRTRKRNKKRKRGKGRRKKGKGKRKKGKGKRKRGKCCVSFHEVSYVRHAFWME